MILRSILFTRAVAIVALLLVAMSSSVAQPPQAPKDDDEVEMPPPNGWDLLVQALKARTGGPGGSPSNTKFANDPAADLAAQRAYVNANAETFRLLRESFRYSVRRPAGDGIDSENAPLRNLGLLLIQKSRVAVTNGKMDEAVEAALDAIQLGIASPRGGAILACLTGTAIESIGRSEMRVFALRLNAAQLREATRRLEKLEALRVSFAEALSSETWVGLRMLQSMFEDESWHQLRTTTQAPRTPIFQEWTIEQQEQFKKLSDRQILINYLRAMDESIALAQLPYAKQPQPQKPNADALSTLIFGEAGSKKHSVPLERAAVENRFLLLQLALQAYRAANNAYPDDLQALTPHYLKQVPLDPFDVKPIHYRRNGEAYVLYSVGPDGVDSGGTAIDNKPPLIEEVNERTRRQVLAESKGDIVATVLK